MNIGIAAFWSKTGTQGGVDIYTRGLVNALAEYKGDHTFIVLVANALEPTWQFRSWPNHIQFKTLYTSDPNWSLKKRILRRASMLAGLNPLPPSGETYVNHQLQALRLDLIHYPSTTIFPLSVNIPAVLTYFDMQQEFYPQFFTAKELASRANTHRPSVEKARLVIAPSTHTRDNLVDKFHCPPAKIRTIPVGIDPDYGSVPESVIRQVKKKYQLPDQFIFYPANPWLHKNHARLMAAMRIYQEKHGTPPYLVLSGQLENETRDLNQYAIAAGVEEFLIDLGFVWPWGDDLKSIYHLAMMLVFPSLFEGFGIPLIEAMACGCPIAAAKDTAIPEVTGDAAILFTATSAESIADTVHQLVSDAGLRKRLVLAGYERLPRFHWENIIPQIISLYEAVTAQP